MPEITTRRKLDQPQRGRTRFELDPDWFPRFSEAIARFLGTGRFLAIQTVVVLVWIAVNLASWRLQWDPYPFILLNLAFSTQAAYAAPLILLAQTRQADRDKLQAERVDKGHTQLEAAAKAETDKIHQLLQANTNLTKEDKELTEQVAHLTKQIHALLTSHQAT